MSGLYTILALFLGRDPAFEKVKEVGEEDKTPAAGLRP